MLNLTNISLLSFAAYGLKQNVPVVLENMKVLCILITVFGFPFTYTQKMLGLMLCDFIYVNFQHVLSEYNPLHTSNANQLSVQCDVEENVT